MLDSAVTFREVIHRMDRRCRNWDYCGTGAYLITLVLNDRQSAALGKVALVDGKPKFRPSPLGAAVANHARRIPEFTPEIEILAVQVMPDHIHFVLRVLRRMARPLGEHLRGFKIGCARLPIDGRARNGQALAHFSAIGNAALLRQPHLLHMQCSRSDFAYARDAQGNPDNSAPPALSTPRFDALSENRLSFARHGAVLVSPCISHGEKEIVRRAFEADCKVVALRNKGFLLLDKPGGKLFDHCAAGTLLSLVLAAWSCLSGKKPITRKDACVLNRIAQLLSGDGVAEINYCGARLPDIDRHVSEVLKMR